MAGERGDDPAWDAVEANALYDLLERTVIPEFYTRDKHGIPTAWVARMRESMAQLTPRFSANRRVCEYTEGHYLPAAATYRERAANHGAVGTQSVEWQRAMDAQWDSLRFGDVRVTGNADHHLFEVELSLNGLDPDAVRVELYADGANGEDPAREAMTRARPRLDATGPCVYHAAVPATRPASDYTVRVVPKRSGVAIPLESARILWHH